MRTDLSEHSVRRLRVFVHSRRGLGLAAYRQRFADGLEHDPAPYGFDLAASDSVEIGFSNDGPYAGWSRRLLARIGFDPLHALYNLRALRRADVIWTVLEWEWLAISLLQRLRLLPRVPVIGNSVWLLQHWANFHHRRRALLRWLMTPAISLTLHARAALERSQIFIPDRKFRVSPFGISIRAFPVTEPAAAVPRDRPIRIYSIGNDGTRDWATMLAAFGNDARFAVTIACSWLGERHDLSRYDNLTWPREVKVADQRRLYEECDIVVIAMLENSYSGITVACEAAAMGKPVICSDTGGVPTYFAPGEVVYVPPGDPQALRDAALASTPEQWRQTALRAQHRFRSAGYATQDMVDRYLALSRHLVKARRGASAVAPASASD